MASGRTTQASSMVWRDPLSSAALASKANKPLVVHDASMVVLWVSESSSDFNLFPFGEEFETLSFGRLRAAMELDSGAVISRMDMEMEEKEKGNFGNIKIENYFGAEILFQVLIFSTYLSHFHQALGYIDIDKMELMNSN